MELNPANHRPVAIALSAHCKKPALALGITSYSSCIILPHSALHHTTLTCTPLNTHSHALQTILLILLSQFALPEPLLRQPSELADHCSTTRRQTIFVAPSLFTLISTTSETSERPPTLLLTLGAYNTRELVWALQCPHQPAAPPAQHNQQFPPHPHPPFPLHAEIAAHAAASATRNQRHHNRDPAKR
jgi:hypothetical protein